MSWVGKRGGREEGMVGGRGEGDELGRGWVEAGER